VELVATPCLVCLSAFQCDFDLDFPVLGDSEPGVPLACHLVTLRVSLTLPSPLLLLNGSRRVQSVGDDDIRVWSFVTRSGGGNDACY